MRNARLLVPGLITFGVALLASGVLAQHMPKGLPSTPALTLLLVPVGRLLMFTFGALALGSACIGGLLGNDARALRLSVRTSLAYGAASMLVAATTLADVLATQWWRALDPRMLRSFLTQIDEGRYLTAQVVIGVVSAWLLHRARQPLEIAFAVIALGIAVALPGFTGHSAASLTHWIASATMVLHLLAISIWIGGVATLILGPTRAALLGFRRIAAVALPAVLLSGMLSVVSRVNDWNTLFHDRYALVLLAKLAVTCAIIAVRLRTRKRIDDSLSATPPVEAVESAVRRTLRFEGALMFVVLGLAVVLARMANP